MTTKKLDLEALEATEKVQDKMYVLRTVEEHIARVPLSQAYIEAIAEIRRLEKENEELNTAMAKTCEDLMGGIEFVTCSRCTLTREYKHVFILRHDGDDREYMCHSCARKSIRGYQHVVRQCTARADAAEARVKELEETLNRIDRITSSESNNIVESGGNVWISTRDVRRLIFGISEREESSHE